MLESKDDEVLFLNDMTDVFATSEVDKALSRIGKEVIRVAKKAAVVGMSKGAKMVLIKAFIRIYGGRIELFDNLEDAKEWLAQG